jgi:hypothetical protein
VVVEVRGGLVLLLIERHANEIQNLPEVQFMNDYHIFVKCMSHFDLFSIT